MSVVENSADKYRISIARGRLIKDYLLRKIEVGTLYFSQKSRLTTPPIIACKHQKIVNYSSPSSHVTLYFVSALRCKNSVVSSGIGGDILTMTSKKMVVQITFNNHNIHCFLFL